MLYSVDLDIETSGRLRPKCELSERRRAMPALLGVEVDDSAISCSEETTSSTLRDAVKTALLLFTGFKLPDGLGLSSVADNRRVMHITTIMKMTNSIVISNR